MRKPLLYICAICLLIGAGLAGVAMLPTPGTRVSGQQDRGWKVWVKTNPCSGRFDWVSVAKENPTFGGGGSYWQNADLIVTGSGLNCVRNIDQNCTFAAATAEAAIVRTSDKFLDYCCKDYSVWRNQNTNKLSIVVGKFGTLAPPWEFEDGPMCCTEAEAITGLTGACGAPGGGKQAGYVGCFKDTSAFDLDGFIVRSQANTPETCVATCRAKGFAFAGVQYSESCLCGNSYGKYGPADNCNMKCTGDPSKNCGGYSANAVYGTGAGGEQKPPPPPVGIDLSGAWQASLTESNTGHNFRYDMVLSRLSSGKWKGPLTLTVSTDPSLGFSTEATLEDLGGGNMRMTYFAKGRNQVGNGTFTKDNIFFGGTQNSVRFTRR